MASRVQTAVTMRQVTGSMANVVRGMDGAMKSMNLEQVGTHPHTHTHILCIDMDSVVVVQREGCGWDMLTCWHRSPP